MATKILIDARKLGDGGIGVYIENLVDGLLRLQSHKLIDVSLSLLVADCFFYNMADGRKSLVSTHFRTNGLGSIVDAARGRWDGRVQFIRESSKKYSLNEFFLLAHRQREVLREQDLYHSPHFTLPFFLGIPSVVTVHDLIHLTHPENFYHRPVAAAMVRSALWRASQVVTVSRDSERQIREFAPKMLAPISVVPNSLRPSLSRSSRDEVNEFRKREFLTRDYCLYVGSERPHKGFWELIDAWAELSKNSLLERIPDLVVVGKNFSVARDRVQELGLDGAIRFFGEVSLDRLELLYSGASAVLVPSRAEGFGLPALEGLGLGVPVICSPIPSLREVCGDAAVYASENSGLGFAQAVSDLLGNPELASRKAAAGKERAERFSVEEFALQTWRVYEAALGRKPTVISQRENDDSLRQIARA